MDRFRQKTKKEKPLKHVDKDNSPSFITDVKSIKENLKIKEILRTVKMNSSMRLKAPRGSKVMNNKDFNDNEDLFNDERSDGSSEQQRLDPPSATNPDVVVNAAEDIDNYTIETENIAEKNIVDISANEENPKENNDTIITRHEDVDSTYEIKDHNRNSIVEYSVSSELEFVADKVNLKSRERKLSLDHTLLTRREGFSQSELDLNSIGKSPLERKSSFFRKKMDSFLKNTTEIFKRQSLGSKSQSVQRRGSMTASLQSLNETTDDYRTMKNPTQGSTISLQSSSTVESVGRSTSSLSGPPNSSAPLKDEAALATSQPLLSSSQPLHDVSSNSVHSLNEAYIEESLLNSRAISMSSGLDSAHSTRRRKSSNRSNRVTWVASEGLTNYFRRIIQDEKRLETQVYHSYSDFTSIPENELSGPRVDSKGRRLSYQRAVSGEDPVLPQRVYDSGRRRPLIPENSEANSELSNILAEFTRRGVPPLQGYVLADIVEDAFTFLHWAECPQSNLEEFQDFKTNEQFKDDFPSDLTERQWDLLEQILLWEKRVFLGIKYGANEEARLSVVRELVNTEAVHIRHLISIVEVFIAAAHALQDAGHLLDVETEKLFSNIPDVLNASLCFWEITIYPMLADAFERGTTFNTDYMIAGFARFRDIFGPHEKFVNEQSKAVDYLRSLSNNSEFMMYLTWCHSQKACKRLQLSDIMVKPMQRLTKYGMILRRIHNHTETEPERTALQAMINYARNHVIDLNRCIRQREELEKLDALSNSIEAFDIDFKDEDLDKYFKMFANLNLKAPMLNCVPGHSRTIIHQGDVRFKDNHGKEMEVRAYLLTDMLLICKKQSKGSQYPYKLIRQKYMVDRLINFPKQHPRNPKEVNSLSFVFLDEVSSSVTAFTLSESTNTKDPNPQNTLKLWEYKIKEAKYTYDLSVWFAKNPLQDISDRDCDTSSDYGMSSEKTAGRPYSDDMNIEQNGRECVAAMVHRLPSAATEYDFSQATMATDSFDAAGDASGATSGAKTPGRGALRHPMYRTSTGGSSRQSRLSSFQQSTSAASHDEPPAGPGDLYLAGTTVEHVIPPQNPDDAATSITVNVVSESESETASTQQVSQPVRAASQNPISGNTLRVQQPRGALGQVHSLPDLSVESASLMPPRFPYSNSPQSASDLLYESHHELLERNRLWASQQHHHLTPGHRGSSYPPPSPTRGSLTRGLAFSYSFKNPPLSKMGHVHSQSQLNAEAGASTSQLPQQAEKPPASPSPEPLAGPSTSSDKTEKKPKEKFRTKHKGGSSRSAPSPCRQEKEDNEGRRRDDDDEDE